MKYIKILAVTVIGLFAINGAKAQVVVAARIGAPAPRTVVVERPVERRVVVVNRHGYRRNYYRRPVVVARPVYHRGPAYYHRPVHRRVIVRHY